jgi:hypothetical protein
MSLQNFQILFIIIVHVKWVSCHHVTARPQVADGGVWPPDMEGSCEYIE